MSNTSGIVTVAKSLDREVNHTARFTVKAQDQTAPFNSDHADVVVMITDVNDNAPVIEPNKMTVLISEVGYFFCILLGNIQTSKINKYFVSSRV